MDFLLLSLLIPYVISVGAGATTEIVSKKLRERLEKAKAKGSQELFAIMNRRSFRDQLSQISGQAAQLMAELGIDFAHEPFLYLLNDPTFQENLGRWLDCSDLAEAAEQKKSVERCVEKVFLEHDLTPAQVESFQQQYFDIAENLYFSDAILVNKRARLDHGKILEKLDRIIAGGPPEPPEEAFQHFFSESWPKVDPALFGREKEIGLLDDAWDDPKTNVVSFVAWGGVGKTALVDWWRIRRMQSEGWRGAERVYAWSFYSQGAAEGRQASADPFIDAALRWFGDPEMAGSASSPWEKGERLAQLVRARRTLLLLDGIERLQNPPGSPFPTGLIKDPALQALLRSLGRGNPGLCVVTTRLPVADLETFEGVSVRSVDLDHLSDEAGAACLGNLGVKGTDEEFREASREFDGHALSLALMGRYLAVAHDGEIRKRDMIPSLTVEPKRGGHARRVMACYEQLFVGKPELDILMMMGLFDRPVEPGAIEALRAEPPIEGLTDQLSSLTEPEWKFALRNLRDVRLLSQESDTEGSQHLDCHPLIREHFGEKLRAQHPGAWCEAHNRLYEYYKSLPEKELPDTLEEMMPLFQAVGHGCRAGRHQDALHEVYWPRIKRRNESYSTAKLGAFGAELAALSGFFEELWSRPTANLTEPVKAFLLNQAGFRLRALGRLAEAVEPFEVGLKLRIALRDWGNAARNADNLSELLLTLGHVPQALEYAEQSVKYADDSGDAFLRMVMRTISADALHQAGRLGEADVAFREAEAMQKERQPEHPLLSSLQGFQYCDLLLGRGEHSEAQRRASQTMEIAKRNRWLLHIALDHLTLGRAALLAALEEGTGDFRTAEAELGQAVDGLRNAGTQHHIPRGFLARAELRRVSGDFSPARRDLDEAFEIATRGGMRLFECDVHLECCRLIMAIIEAGAELDAQDIAPDSPFALYDAAQDPLAAAHKHLEKSGAMIDDMGYGRRDPEILLETAHLQILEDDKDAARKTLAAAKEKIDEMGCHRWDRDLGELSERL